MLEDHNSDLRETRDERASDPQGYPSLHVASPGLVFGTMPLPVPGKAGALEVIFLRSPRRRTETLSYHAEMFEWNVLWESAHLRAELFDYWKQRDFPVSDWLLTYIDRNIHFVPDNPLNPSETFQPLYSMLPAPLLAQVGLPATGRGLWPACQDIYGDMPRGAQARFERALSLHLWPRLMRGKAYHAFSERDPIHILTHSPMFWMPHALHVCFERASWYERDAGEWTDEQRHKVEEANAHPTSIELGVAYKATRHGGPLWVGEAEAAEATDEMIELADSGGRLRSLIDAVLSNRAHDDFSPYWTHEREDFERAMYHKRARISVAFVELPEQEAIHSAFTELVESPEHDVVDRLMFNDFLTLLDEQNRSIVICMRRGLTTASEISRALGYANHSPVTKRLHKIRAAARRFFLEDRSV